MAGFEALAHSLREHGLGLILDIVPNHMGIGPDNPWWWDVLEHGRSSRYAGFFDIDFDRDPDGKLVLPTLGFPLDEILSKGELKLKRDEARGGLVLAYYDTPFPLAPGSAKGLDPERVDEGAMRRLLDAQAYRLAFWRESERRNYRRFFDIGELAGLRIELPEVFEATHALIFDLVERGLVQGLRVDHVDGLADPKGYLDRLQDRLRHITRSDQPFYVLVEKILVGEERLPADWQVAGTTGYEFANQVLGLLVDPDGIDPLERLRAEMTGEPDPFPAVVDRAKRLVLEKLFAGELNVLAEKAHRLLDLPQEAAKAAITELLVAFPVYRTYRRDEPLGAADRAVLERAVAAARSRLEGEQADRPRPGAVADRGRPGRRAPGLGDGLPAALRARHGEGARGHRLLPLPAPPRPQRGRRRARRARRRAGRVPRDERRAAGAWPHTMLGTATHDTKRGEDTRARLAVLSEVPEAWAEAVRGWRGLNAAVRPASLHPKDEYTLYQALVGVWPEGLEPGDEAALAALRGQADVRVRGYLAKALREGKERTSWLDQDAGYEEEALGFVDALFDPARSRPFLDGLRDFVNRVAPAGHANALAQLLVKLTAPGVPDVYQGTELWDLSLVDPDNRRPVDWRAREDLLDDGRQGDPARDWVGGAIKMRVLARTLAFRRQQPELYAVGDYLPLALEGERAGHAFAFARRQGGLVAVTLVGRHQAALLDPGRPPPAPPERWGDTALVLPEDLAGTAFEDRLTGATLVTAGRRLPLRRALAALPVALLVAGG